MKLIVPVFQTVDGTPIIGMRRRRLSNSIRCKLCAEGCPVFYAGQPIYYRFRMANHEKEALLSLIAPFALAYMPTVHPVKPPADSVL